MWLIRIGAPLVLVAAGITTTAVPAAAEDPVMHDVTYTVYTETPFYSEIYYRDFEPADFADYSHNPYLFSPNVEAIWDPISHGFSTSGWPTRSTGPWCWPPARGPRIRRISTARSRSTARWCARTPAPRARCARYGTGDQASPRTQIA